METQICPFCKCSMSGNAKKCPGCGRKIPVKTSVKMSRTKTLSVVAAMLIIIAAALYATNRISGDNSPLPVPDNPLPAHNSPLPVHNASEAIPPKLSLKDSFEAEFTPDDIMVKINSFMQNTEADSLIIKELILEPGTEEDTYRVINNNENVSISIAARKEDKAVTSVSISVRSDNGPESFITCCFALMDIFTPVMKADIRQNVVFAMMGYEEGADKPLADKNTYIILETKYIYTNDEQKGLSLSIEQMPELEIYEGTTPPIL